MGSPSGEEVEGESPRGGDKVMTQVKAPYHFGVIFEKHVVLKSFSKNSDGKKKLMIDFSEIQGAKGAQNRCFGMTFVTLFGDFFDFREIVKMKLSPARELHREGWRDHKSLIL